MDTSKYTPGPWQLDGPETAHVTDDHYHNIRAGVGFWAQGTEGRELGFSISGHMSPADARLIASAPDLVMALRDMIDLAEAHAASAYCQALDGQDRFALDAARAVLAAAVAA